MRAKLNVGRRAGYLAAALISGIIMVPAMAAGPELGMFKDLRKGSWEIHNRDTDSRSRICIKSGRELIQLRHPQGGCNQFVVQDTASEVTVHYSCPRDGYGQTKIRMESAKLVQINTQGVKGQSPFNFNAEGRFVGGC